MSARLEAINITCRDHAASGARWAEILGLEPEGDITSANDFITYRIPGTKVYFAFQPPDNGEVGDTFVPRIHLDAVASGNTREQELENLLARGMTLVVDARTADGAGWFTVEDVDGTQICVGRSDEERAAAKAAREGSS